MHGEGNKLMQDLRAAGFTIIEIIVTMVLISIISVVVMSRFVSGNAFNGVIVRDQIISLARTAQQNALGRANVEMTITPNAGATEVTIATNYGVANIASITVPMSSLSLSGDVNDTDSCATGGGGADAITLAAPMTIAFGKLADLGSSGVSGGASTGPVSSAVRVCLNNDPALSVCFSPSGFAYTGDCDV